MIDSVRLLWVQTNDSARLHVARVLIAALKRLGEVWVMTVVLAS
jgi:hypothetical protein